MLKCDFLGTVLLVLILPIFLLLGARCSGASEEQPLANNPGAKNKLLALAVSIFPKLSTAEIALLRHADVANVGRSQYAAGGPSVNPDDPSNNPESASHWGPQREIRATLIRWMSVDPNAVRQIDPQGIRVLGAKIVGGLDLSQVHVPFAITLRNCAIPETMAVVSAEIPALDLQGSYLGSIHSLLINVPRFLGLSQVHLTGIADFTEARIGALYANDGHFKYAAEPDYWAVPSRAVLNLTSANIEGTVYLDDGFEADGEVNLNGARINSELNCISGHFFNPGNVAIDAIGTKIAGDLLLMGAESSGFSLQHGGPVRISGLMRLRGTRIGSAFIANQIIFSGPAGTPNGLEAPETSVEKLFWWTDITTNRDTQLNLSGASIGYLSDQERSWPVRGKLVLDGLTYSGFETALPTPVDANTRLKWIERQAGYHPQPYRQLAKVLLESGDEKGATKVLIAQEDARYQQLGLPGWLLGTFLKYTIGYGHRPLLALSWSLGVVLIGSAMVSVGSRAGLMAPCCPEHKPAEDTKSHENLHPLLYSLDTFLPVVDLHQEQYWWPDATRTGSARLFGSNIKISGRFLRHYLWLQIIAGWLLSAIFVAGVTGLIRND